MGNTKKQLLIAFVLFTSLLSLNLTKWSFFKQLINLVGYAFVSLFLSWQASKLIYLFPSKVDPQDKAVFITGKLKFLCLFNFNTSSTMMFRL